MLFWALGTKSYEKGPFGVFFRGHSDSLNMNDTKLTFIGLVQLNIDRPSFGNEPLLSQVHKTYEFGLVFGRAITSVCYPLWTHEYEKRHSSTMMGKLWEGNHFANKWQFVVTFEHGTCLHIISVNWVFSWFPSRSTFMSHVSPLSLSKEWIVHCHTMCLSGLVMLPSLLSCCPMFKVKLKKFTSTVETVSV